MERNYTGQGGYAGTAQGSLVSSGRRAGQVRSAGSDDRPPLGYSSTSSSHATDSSQSGHVPRYGRRASPVAAPRGDGMEMDPPRYQPSPASGAPAPGLVRPSRGTSTPPSQPASAAAGAAAAGSGKLSGLARLKEAAASRLVNRIPSANGRSSGADSGGYVPSVITNPQPARALPSRVSSGGGGGGGSGSGGGGGYGSGYGGSSSYGTSGGSAGGARSASTGAAMGAAGRPPSGGGYGSGSASSSSRQPSNGYGGGYGAGSNSGAKAARQAPPPPPPQQQQQYASGGYGQPAAAAAPVRRPVPQPAAAAPPPAQMARPHHHHNSGSSHGGGGGGGGGFGGGAAFGPGSVPPGADEVSTGPMVECPTCGRSFNQQAYSKHAKVCEKVFATKRKPVNMAAKRLEGSEAIKFFDTRKGVPKSEAKQTAAAPAGRAGGRGGGRGGGLDDRPLPPSKVPKWKAQSEQLRAAMAANRQIVEAKAKGVDIRDVKFTAGPSVPDDRVQCPHCGRKFAELTAERHIPKCRDIQAKPGRLAAGGGRGAHMRR